MFKIILQKDYFKTCNKWVKWWGLSIYINICPQGVVCPCPGAVYMCKNIKIYTRTRCQVSVCRTTGPLVFYNIHRNSIRFSFLEDNHVGLLFFFFFMKWGLASSAGRSPGMRQHSLMGIGHEIMHQSFVVPAGNSGAFNFSVFKALHCGDKFKVIPVMSPPPSPPPPEADIMKNNKWPGPPPGPFE